MFMIVNDLLVISNFVRFCFKWLNLISVLVFTLSIQFFNEVIE